MGVNALYQKGKIMDLSKEYVSAYCPSCGSLIKLYEDKTVFTGDPALCSCRVAQKDLERFNLDKEEEE